MIARVPVSLRATWGVHGWLKRRVLLLLDSDSDASQDLSPNPFL